MNFDLTDDQRQIKDTARQFLADRYKPERIRELVESEDGFSEEGWRQMAELGWTGLAVPEEWGGAGLGMVELAVVFEEMGYSLAPAPLLSSTIVGLALSTFGTDDQKDRFLRPLAAGEVRATPALYDAGTPARVGEFTLEARHDGDGIVLDGEKVLVMDAEVAGFFLVATSDGRRHLVERADDGVSVTPEPALDLTRRLYSVKLEQVRVPAERTLPEADGLAFMPVFDRLCVALAAELTGVAQRMLELAVSHAKEREQFGRPVGAYQAVSHRCAQMLLETESARSLTYYAAWAAGAEPESLPRAASMAKAYASDAGFRVPAAALQVLGGIGFTWEHDLHLWLRRGRADAAAFGDARWHRERVAALILDAEGAPEPPAEVDPRQAGQWAADRPVVAAS
jgi:alkylation response protein AidB-like acyl-CoA dehydrogenase